MELALSDVDILMDWLSSHRELLDAEDVRMPRDHLVLAERLRSIRGRLVQAVQDKMESVTNNTSRETANIRVARRRMSGR
jgi:hypothetical protein